MDGSYQSLEALPIEHLQIVFVASSTSSEDDTSAITQSYASTVTTPVCQQRPAVKKTSGLSNGYASHTPIKANDVKAKPKKSPTKMAAAKRTTGKGRERAKRPEIERKTGVDEEVLDSPPDGWPLRRVISIEEDHLPHLLHGGPQPLLHQLSEEEVDEEEEEEGHSDFETSVAVAADLTNSLSSHTLASATGENSPVRRYSFNRAKKTPMSPRGQPVGKETQQVCPQTQTF